MLSRCPQQPEALGVRALSTAALILYLLNLLIFTGVVSGTTDAHFRELRQETENLFYHGFNNYMELAFPDDELRPITCTPLTRDRENPSQIGFNDPLGNYSLTLVDSLSTLAILASSSESEKSRKRAFSQFQKGVEALVEQYGDGSKGAKGVGTRAHGFDLDSKVQVFETVIRGVGGLLSAHLFAVGELPITGYQPQWNSGNFLNNAQEIKWSHRFSYDGQLLRLAHDLGKRLLPAFSTSTGLPYPRVNLRHGIPFYQNSAWNCPMDNDQEESYHRKQCPAVPLLNGEATETCSAGAASLVLEFTVLSRLTGDSRFENFAKRAFWSVWERRSNIGLIGAGIDAETGLWMSPYTGLGAGIDSFFEYAVKSYILLSGSTALEAEVPDMFEEASIFDPPPLTPAQHEPESYLEVWQEAHAAVKRHLYRGKAFVHPHYIQADLHTGAARAFWMDSLSAFFPGLLTLTGDIQEAIETHLLFTALWNRYSALPERWSTTTGKIEGGLTWWGGRPEFIESTYHIYRASRDPWYIHVGEMAMRDIKRRCWTKCGWSGIQDVRNGERSDRMESFFLGETAKYLHLLFDPDHPLNKLDAPFVFTTEGHPLLIPKSTHSASANRKRGPINSVRPKLSNMTCPVRTPDIPLSVSVTASRPDIFNAANLARLHHMPTIETLDSPLIEYASDHPSISLSDVRSPSNFTYFPWTLPLELVPYNGVCESVTTKATFDITFPTLPSLVAIPGILQRVKAGILVTGMTGLRLGMIQDGPDTKFDTRLEELYRVYAVNNIPLGKDEKVYMAENTVSSILSPLDPNFTRVRHPAMLDLVLDVKEPPAETQDFDDFFSEITKHEFDNITDSEIEEALNDDLAATSHIRTALNFFTQRMSSMLSDHISSTISPMQRISMPAIIPTGAGAAPIPDVPEAMPTDPSGNPNPEGALLWNTIAAVGYNCDDVLPARIPREHQVIVMKRGRCSFSQKLENIASFAPSPTSLQMVIVVSGLEGDVDGDEEGLIRPFLEGRQVTPGGLPRQNPIPMVMVAGGDEMYGLLKNGVALGLKRRYEVQAQGVPISNLIIL